MPELNFKKLEEQFNLTPTDVKNEIKEIKQNLKDQQDNISEDDDPDKIIRTNIDRANELLDLIMVHIGQGSLTAGLMQAAAGLISEITNAANSIASREIQFDDQELKHQQMSLKQEELELKKIVQVNKQKYLDGKNNSVNNNEDNDNVIKMNRNEVLKIMIEAEDEPIDVTPGD